MRLLATRLTAIAGVVRNLFRGASLDLSFAGADTLDPRVTFSRASNATVTGPDGALQYAPHNLLTHSEQFDNAAWIKSSATVSANAAAAPDGSLTADALQKSAAFGNLRQTIAAANSAFTASAYVKAGTEGVASFGITENGTAVILIRGSVDLRTGVVTNGLGSFTATPVGGGWWRLTGTATSTTGTNVSLLLYPGVFSGSEAGSVFVWGAQLNVGPLQPYYPTTVKNALGFTQEFDNAAWTKSNSFVQTNLLTFSEQFDNAAWGKARCAVLENAAIAPNGTLTADKLADDGALVGIGYIGQNFTWAGGVTYTGSFYVKAGEYSSVSAYFTDPSGITAGTSSAFNLSSGTVTSGAQCSIQPVGNGWYRVAIVGSPASGSGTLRILLPSDTASSSGIYIWGAQLVQGSTPGDYQRTEAAAKAVMYPAPDGSLTADKLVENTASSIGHFLQPAASPVFAAGQLAVYSAYAKAAERSLFQIILTGIGPGPSNFIAGFDLQAGTAGEPTPGARSQIVAVGNGWYRCSLSVAAATAASAIAQLRLSQTSTAIPSSYTGDGTSGIYIWGAQLSDSASLDPYVYNPEAAPTAQAYYGPRFDYDPITLAPKGLLIEEQRTNLCLRSGEVDSGLHSVWQFAFGASALLPGGSTAAPDGTLSGRTYTIQTGATATTGYQQISVTANTVYTWSLYVRLGTLPSNDYRIAFRDDTNGVFIAESVLPTLVSVGGGWSKITYTLTTPAGCLLLRCYPIRNTATATGGTISFWGAQLEAGSFATSYIPTTTAAATRAADVAVMTGANFSNWYRQDEGTLFAEGDAGLGTLPCFASIDDTTTNNRIQLRRTTGDTLAALRMVSPSGSIDVTLTSGSAVGLNKQAASFSAGNQNAAANGALFTGITPIASMPTVNRMDVGAGIGSTLLNGHIRRIGFFPRRLTNAELQGLTA